MMENLRLCMDCKHRFELLKDFPCKECYATEEKPNPKPNWEASDEYRLDNPTIDFGPVLDCGIRLEDVQEDVIMPYQPPQSDPVAHPNHYCKGGMECIDAIKAAVTGLTGFEAYCTGNILKYIWRWHDKNGAEDLRKAKQYIDFLIEEVEK